MGRVIFVLILGALVLGCTTGAPTYYQDDAAPVCVEQPDPWPCLRIGAQLSGLTGQLATASDTLDSTKIASLTDDLDRLGIDYNACLQSYGSAYDWSSP